MRSSSKRSAVTCALALAALLWASAAPATHGAALAPAQPGITIAPAALTLTLPKGATQATTSFDVTNRYAATVTVSFKVEPGTASQNALNPGALAHLVTIGSTELVIEPGQTGHQTLTLLDDQQLPPGSQDAVLVASQLSTGSAGAVGVATRIQLPLTLIKQDGAVSSLGLTSLDTPAAGLTIPGSVRVHLRNTGNVTVIPHGYVTITSPQGTIVAKGIINAGGQAMGVHGTLTLNTPLTRLATATLPGAYKVTAAYGLGSGQATAQQSRTLWFVAWWHLVLIIALAFGLYRIKNIFTHKLHKLKSATHPPPTKRTVLIGRDIT